MIRHESVYAWRAYFDRTRLFETPEEARAFDRGFAVEAIGILGFDGLRVAFSNGDRKVAAMLRFLAEEIEDNPPAPMAIDAEQPAA